MKKADIVIRYYDGRQRPVVNVKIGRVDIRSVAAKVAADNNEPRFSEQWMIDNVSDDTRSMWWDEACQQGFNLLEDEVNDRKVFGRKVSVASFGRSNGWVGLERFYGEDVASWDAKVVRQWALFAKIARVGADDVAYQYCSLILLNTFAEWAKQQSAVQSFCEQL